MPKLTPKKNFILRYADGKRVIARKGVKIDVTEDEHRKLPTYFVEEPPKVKRRGVLSIG